MGQGDQSSLTVAFPKKPTTRSVPAPPHIPVGALVVPSTLSPLHRAQRQTDTVGFSFSWEDLSKFLPTRNTLSVIKGGEKNVYDIDVGLFLFSLQFSGALCLHQKL